LYTVVHTAFVSFQARFTAAWQSEGFDAVICPGMGVPALRHGESKDLTPSCSYTLLWNVLHYPVGSVPVGLVDKSETGYEEAPGTAKDLFTSKTAASVAGSEGLPVGVQVAALPWRDEIVLRVMRDLERRIRFDERPQLAKQLQI
jgi:fatty acid amide hydrolase